VFAPIIRLSNYEKALVRSGVAAKGIESRFKAIRDQSVSSIFYLAKGGGLDDEFIALLDDVHTMPSAYSPAKKQENKLFTLSQAGFYLFLFKISVHFCRFQEGIHR